MGTKVAGKRLRDERGQGLVEFALLVPVFIIIVFAIVDFGMGLRAYITVAQATREGARYAAIGNPPGTFTAGGAGECDGETTTTTVGRVCDLLDNLDLSDVSSVTVTYPNGAASGNSVRVHAAYDYHYITPVQSIVNVLAGGSMPDHLTISSTTDMRLE